MKWITINLIFCAVILILSGCGTDSPTPISSASSDNRIDIDNPTSGEPDADDPISPPLVRIWMHQDTSRVYEEDGTQPGNATTTEESDLAALWLSGELTVPAELSELIQDELTVIRHLWEDTIPEVNIGFFPSWMVSELVIGLTDGAYDSIRAGLYHHWDDLNQQYGLDSTNFWDPAGYRNVQMFFGGMLNSNILVDYYAGLPGFRYVNVNGLCCDWPILLIHDDGEELHYFFRDAWGDCFAGCIYQRISYFTVDGNAATYHGTCENYNWEPIPWPGYYIAKELYWQHNSWNVEG